ncbi:MAG TPA: hypothetical protein VLA96_02235 [Terriglobales bacterium]|nr:hypothetical protein [Terriglobales bacterium]
MKNTVRAALVLLMIAGGYAGVATPAPAMTQPPQITVQEGSAPKPCYPTPNNPCPPPIIIQE